MATATTVPACVGVLTVPKLGPPAQDLIGAVLPTATRHAGRGVINFKPARQEKDLGVGKLNTLLPKSRISPTVLSPLEWGTRIKSEGTDIPSHKPQCHGTLTRIRMRTSRHLGTSKGTTLTPQGTTPKPCSLLQCLSEELIGAMIVFKNS